MDTILRDMRVLTEDFIPQIIPHRENQLLAIRDCVKPVLEGRKPSNAFLHGEPGTGKTCLSKFVLEELAKYSGSVLTSYVNCWVYPSRFKVYYTIIENFGKALAVHRKGTPTDELYDLLQRLGKKQPCIVVMDEVDQLEDDRVIYDLLQAGFGLILIANSETALHDVDSRVRSRLAGIEQIQFPKYRVNEVADILKARVEYALIPGAIKRKLIDKIAELSGGDARAGLGILRSAVEAAERQDSEKILDKHIKGMDGKKPARSVEALNQHQKILYNIIKSGISLAGDVYEEYQKQCKKKGIEPLVDRTLRKYMEKLVRYRLVNSEGDARWRKFTVKD